MEDILREVDLAVKKPGDGRLEYVEILLPDSAYVNRDIHAGLRPEIAKAINDRVVTCTLRMGDRKDRAIKAMVAELERQKEMPICKKCDPGGEGFEVMTELLDEFRAAEEEEKNTGGGE